MNRWRYDKPVIGLAGGIGSGKSLVARQLASLGCGVIDADALARAALDEPQVRDQLMQWWGPKMLDADGRVDRQAVARIVFDDPAQLKRLESATHPRVRVGRERLRRRMLADPSVRAIVEDCPLLYEAALDGECDVVIFVTAGRPTRLARLASSRGWTEAQLEVRERNQLPLDFKSQRADYVVDNDAGESETYSHVRSILAQILQEPT